MASEPCPSAEKEANTCQPVEIPYGDEAGSQAVETPHRKEPPTCKAMSEGKQTGDGWLDFVGNSQVPRGPVNSIVEFFMYGILGNSPR